MNDEFRRKFAAFVERAKGNQREVAMRVALHLADGVIKRSPVDTGRFRGNWQLSTTGMPRSITDDLDDQSPYARESNDTYQKAVVDVRPFKLGQTIWIVNNLPYSKRLEYGWSSQAPGGMVRITIAEFDQYLTRVVGSLKK